MQGFTLFPKIRSGFEWVAGHSDAVIQFGWNIVAAAILLFIGKFISRLLSRGLEKLLLKRRVDVTIIQFFTALVRYIILAFLSSQPWAALASKHHPLLPSLVPPGWPLAWRYRVRCPTLRLACYWFPYVHFAPARSCKLAWLPERWKRCISSQPPCSPPIAKKW